MAVESKTFPSAATTIPAVTIRVRSLGVSQTWLRRLTWAQVILAFLFMECAVWAARLSVRSRWALGAGIVVVLMTLLDRPTLPRLGLTVPSLQGTALILAITASGIALMVLGSRLAGGQIPANPNFPNWHLAWKYVIWALLQEFMLQSFFFTRLEELVGSSRAVWVTGTLFAAFHLPNPILTACTLISGLVFCEMFRRYRSIFPLGISHAALGLTLALTVPDGLLYHLRVGIGYLQ